jgi:phage terminase large subunit-like protein
MSKYLGQTIVDHKSTKYKDYTINDWVMYFIECYGGYDGAHHKDWVLDQVARILKGTPIIIELAKWSCGTEEYRISTAEPSQEYVDWVIEMENGEDGEDTYDYSIGIAP